MVLKPIKMTYIPAQFRVRAEITVADAKSSPLPPADLMMRVQKKMQMEKQAGHIASFHCYEDRLQKIWQTLRTLSDDKEMVALTLACGAPEIRGIEVSRGVEGSKTFATLSITATPEELHTWRYPLVKLAVQTKLKALGIQTAPNPARIHALWLKAMEGGKVVGAKLYPLTLSVLRAQEIDFEFYVSPHKKQINLMIYSFKNLLNRDPIRLLVHEAHEKAFQLSQETGHPYHFLKADLIRSLRSALRGPERFDFDLPFAALVCRQKISGAAKPAVMVEKLHDHYEITVSDDNMQVEISAFHMELYERAELGLSATELKRDIVAQGILSGMQDPLWQTIAEHLDRKESLKGLVVAKGLPPVAAAEPFLELIPLTGIGSESGPGIPPAQPQHRAVNMRDRQPSQFASAGQVVGKISYRTPAIPGQDVYGRALGAASPDHGIIEIGTGLELMDSGLLKATIDGIPLLEGPTKAGMQPAYVHNGDVNLTTGNIRFSGSVHIKGNVEQGSILEVGGDLVIDGMVQGGCIRCQGSVRIAGGFIGNENLRSQVKGDLQAQFLEHVHLDCRGSITAQQSIVGCYLSVGGNLIILAQDGQYLGGKLVVSGEMQVAFLGKEDASKTHIILGASWIEMVRIQHQERRIQALEKLAQIQTLEQLKWQNPKRLSPTERPLAKERLQSLKEREQKLKLILEQMRKILQSRLRKRTYNKSARLTVNQTLATNCLIDVQNQIVPIHTALDGVYITMTPIRNNFIRPLVDPKPVAS